MSEGYHQNSHLQWLMDFCFSDRCEARRRDAVLVGKKYLLRTFRRSPDPVNLGRSLAMTGYDLYRKPEDTHCNR